MDSGGIESTIPSSLAYHLIKYGSNVGRKREKPGMVGNYIGYTLT